MSITTLDPRTALIIIDLQKGIVSLPVVHPTSPVIAGCNTLIGAFRARGLPVVLVNVTGGAPGRNEQGGGHAAPPADWADLVPELDVQAGDILISKQTWGAFTNTTLEAQLRDLGVTQVVIAGIATSIGVESTARQAWELGLNVTLAVDAMTDLNMDTHENSVKLIFPRLGETGTVADVVGKLAAA